MKKKIIKISIISGISFLIIITILILLLSILFPNELVRKQIEIQGKELLGVDVTVEKFKFNVFTGIHLKNFSIPQGRGTWRYPDILTIDNVKLDYRLFPLFKKEISVRACVVENGQIHLERYNGVGNWEYFLHKLESLKSAEKDTEKKEKKEQKEKVNKDEKTDISIRNKIPIDINIKKAGLDQFKVTYDDNSFFDIPMNVQITDIKFLAKKVSLKENKPMDVTANINLNLDAGKHIILGAKAKAFGKIKLFEEGTDKISPSGPIDIKLVEAKFNSEEIKGLVLSMMNGVMKDKMSPVITSALNNPDKILEQSDVYFNEMLNSSDSKIKEFTKEAENILAKKSEYLNYNKQLLGDFDKKMDNSVNKIDKQIDQIDKEIKPIMDTVANIPLIDTMIDINSYKKRIKKLKSNAQKKKNEFTAQSTELEKSLNDQVNSQFPAYIPNYNSLKKDFDKKINTYKSEIGNKINKISIDSFISSLVPDISFLDKEIKVEKLTTTYYLGKKQSEAKKINLESDLFNLEGDMTVVKKNIDYSGNITAHLEKLNISYFPVTSIKTKVSVKGEIPKLKIKILELPDFKIDESKTGEIINQIIGNFLSNNYNDDRIISSLMGGFSYKDINEDSLKANLKNTALTKQNGLGDQENEINKYIQKEIDKILKDLNKNVPGL